MWQVYGQKVHNPLCIHIHRPFFRHNIPVVTSILIAIKIQMQWYIKNVHIYIHMNTGAKLKNQRRNSLITLIVILVGRSTILEL